jgi:hypothetical protein
MIEVTVRDGLYIVRLPTAVLVLTKAEVIHALRRGTWWPRRQAWRSEDDRSQARTTLAESVATARRIVARVQGPQDPALQQVLGHLIIHSDLSEDSLKHPEMLRRYTYRGAGGGEP